MKKIIALILCSILLVGCAKYETVDCFNDKASMFVVLEQTYDHAVVYQRNTKVMYAVSLGTYNAGTFTLLVNADGTPMTYTE